MVNRLLTIEKDRPVHAGEEQFSVVDTMASRNIPLTCEARIQT